MSKKVEYQDLLDAGVHFGHLTRKWNPQMAPYIFMEKNDIHIIDLNKTKACLEDAQAAMKNIVKSGRKVLFVATKKQAREIVSDEARRLKMPFVTERWLGGMLTNFMTVKKSLKKMSSIDKLMKDDSFNSLAKKERLMISREREKLEKLLGGITELTRLPAALFIIDAKKEHIAVAEARRLNIPVFAIVDTNTNPNNIDFPIPGNDDAYKSISILTKAIGSAIEDALEERKRTKDEDKEESESEDENGKPKKKAKVAEEEEQ
jgi:small subunit ribosomal protein S2